MKRKKISTILPAELLAQAVKLSETNQTDTIVLALKELVRGHKRKSILSLKGKINITFDVNKERNRNTF